MFNQKRGQSTLEYAVIIAVVVAALLAIQIYMKRGVQGKLRESSDKIGEQYSAGNTVGTEITTHSPSKSIEQFGIARVGESRYEVITPENTTVNINENTTVPLSQESLF